MTDFIHFTNLLKKSVPSRFWGEMECFFIDIYNDCNDALKAYQISWEKYVAHGL